MQEQLTKSDVAKIEAEIEHRKLVVRPKALADVKEARAHGDLSENFEYYAAKKFKNQNESRIRYLERMIRTAKVISAASQEDAVGLFDTVVVFNQKLQREMTLRLVTTLRADAHKGLISKESPVGKALLGRKAGETVHVKVSDSLQYDMVIRSIEKGEDDESLSISSF